MFSTILKNCLKIFNINRIVFDTNFTRHKSKKGAANYNILLNFL